MVSTERHRYVVALDFGTTFTGKCMFFSRKQITHILSGISHVNATKTSIDDIQVIKNWPGPSKEFSEVWKTPSKIAYRSENLNARNLKEDAEEIVWGYDVEPGMISYSWMKLYLDEATSITEYDDVSLAGLADSQGEACWCSRTTSQLLRSARTTLPASIAILCGSSSALGERISFTRRRSTSG
jgi:hypothetical protein